MKMRPNSDASGGGRSNIFIILRVMGITTGGHTMAKKDTSGLMSSAGIMRYFEAEESAIKIDPLFVIAGAIVFGALIWGLNMYFRMA